MISLRPYQDAAVEAAFAAWDRGDRSTLLEMATGTGKTTVFCAVVRRMIDRGQRAMIVADQGELIEQAARRVESQLGFAPAIEMADRYAETGLWGASPVVVASKDSLHSGRLSRFKPTDFGLIVLDEADKVVRKNKTWWRLLEHFYANPFLRVLGVTATPQRKDKAKLCFDSVAYRYPLLDAIADGWLVAPEQEYLAIKGLDFDALDTSTGDFTDAQIADVLDAERVAHEIVHPALVKCQDGLTLVVSPTVDHAEMTASVFNRWRPDAAVAISGKTDKLRRAEVLAAFSRREFQYLCVCGLCTRGWDEPQVANLVMNRPTRSLTVYLQALGRITRTWPGVVDGLETPEQRKAAIAGSRKPVARVFDPVGNSAAHKAPVSTANVLGGHYPDEVVAAAVKTARQKGGPVDMRRELEEAQQRATEESERRRQIRATVQWESRKVDFFDHGDTASRSAAGRSSDPPATDNQRAFLHKHGIDTEGMTKREASKQIGDMKSRWANGQCSPKQAKLLRRHGERGDMPSCKAKAVLDLLAARDWQPRDYALTRERWAILRKEDGRYVPIIKDDVAGKVPVSISFRTEAAAREWVKGCLESNAVEVLAS